MLRPTDIAELKTLRSPSELVVAVLGAVKVLLAPPGSTLPQRDELTWGALRRSLLASPERFAKRVAAFDAPGMVTTLKAAFLQPLFCDERFSPELVRPYSKPHADSHPHTPPFPANYQQAPR